MCDVNIATGEVTQFEFDVLLSGRIPWQLIRRYSSRNPQHGLVGFGWKLNLGAFLLCRDDLIDMVVDGEPFATFPVPGIGQRLPPDESGLTVERRDAGITVTDRYGNMHAFPCWDPLPRVVPCSARYDAYRNVIEYDYDDGGRLRRLVDTFQRPISFTYDAHSQLVEIYIPVADGSRWPLVRYEYDQQGDLVAAFDAMGHPTRYEYSSHLLTRVTDRSGRDLFYQYDHDMRCARTWFTGGVWDRQISHDAKRSRVLVTNPDGHSVLYTHNGKGTVTGYVDAIGRVREDVVTADGQLLSRSGAGAGSTTLIVREPGSRTVRLYRDGAETVFEVDANDQVTWMRSPDGSLRTYEYDRAGNLRRSEAPGGTVWAFAYDDHGDLVRSVDPVGYERHRERGPDRLVLRDHWGVRLEERLDYLGRPTRLIDANGGEVRIAYDASGNALERVNPDGTSAAVEYDPGGRPIVFTDELGRQTRLERDPTETRVRLLRPDGREELFEYGLMDELRRITNAKGETAGFDYDGAGRCPRIVYFDGREHAVVYDEADNPTALADGRTGRVLAQCRYEDDALVEESYFDGRRVTIDYGPAGDVVRVENDHATLSFERDELMRIVVAQADDLELRYTYDARGDCTRVESSAGRRIDYKWDGRRRLVEMVDSSSGTYEYAYEGRDLVTDVRLPNGCTQHFEYDARHRMVLRRVTRGDGTEVCSRTFSYDAAGRLTAYEDSLRGARRYTYDTVDAVTSVADDGVAVGFRHDSNGNLLNTRGGDIVTYAAGDRPTRVGTAELEYDDRGNLVVWRSPAGESRFEYTGEGWLKRAVLANGTTVDYEYDGTARRTAKTVDGRRTEYAWNGVHLLQERTAGEAIEYLFMPGSFFLAGVTVRGRHYSYVFDQLGTPTELVDESGEIAWAADYSAHGEIIRVRSAKVPQPFRFLGQYCDDELGWHYNWHRYYHPVIGRFTSPDPLGFAAGINLYRYAPNPVNWVDPFGLAFASPGVGGNPAKCEVLSRCDWGPKMMEEAKKKTEGVNEKGCDAKITGDCDRPPDQKDYYMKNCVAEDDKAKVEASLKSQSDSCKSKQVDHVKEVQCGGKNECDNLAPLTQTVNGSFGSQIKSCRDQLAAQGVKGTVRMVISLVSIRSAPAATLKRHGKQPCDSNTTRCP